MPGRTVIAQVPTKNAFDALEKAFTLMKIALGGKRDRQGSDQHGGRELFDVESLEDVIDDARLVGA